MSENTTSKLPVKVGATTAEVPVRVEGTLLLASLGKAGQAASGTKTMFDALTEAVGRMKRSTAFFTALNEKLQDFSGSMDEVLSPGIALDSAIAAIASTSGQTGEGLEKMEHYARQSAKTFGGSAADSAGIYKELLERLSPRIAEVPEALARMGDNVLITSKIMGNDTKGAMDVLTTAMTQFGVSVDDPEEAAGTMSEMMNIMAAAARNGSAPLPVIQAALQQSGDAARNAGLSFAETNAAIQLLDRAGMQGSKGGMALHQVLTSLAESRFLPSDVQQQLQEAGVDVNLLTDRTLSLAQRMQPLRTVMHNNVLMTKMFGEEQAGTASVLLTHLTEMEQLTTTVQGTSAAVDQAGMRMDSYSENLLRQKSRIDDLKIGLFQFTESVWPYVKGTIGMFQELTNVMTGVNFLAAAAEMVWTKAIYLRNRALSGGIKAILNATGIMAVYNVMTVVATGVSKAFSLAIKGIGKAIYSIPVIGWIAAGISLLITVFKVLWDNCEGFRRILFGVWQAMKAVFYNIGVVLQSVYENLIKPIFVGLWEVVKSVAGGIADGFSRCWEGIVAGVTTVGGFFVSLWDGIVSAFSAVGDFFSGLWSGITDTCSGVITYLSDAFSAVADPICEVFSGIWETVTGIFDKIAGYVQKFFGWIGKLWNKIFPKDQFKDVGEEYRKGLEAGSESFRKSRKIQEKEEKNPERSLDGSGKMVPAVFKPQNSKTKGAAGKNEAQEPAANLKGSTGYGAIVAGTASLPDPVKMNPVSGKPSPAASVSNPSECFTSGVQGTEAVKNTWLSGIATDVRKIAAGITVLAGMANMSPVAVSAADIQLPQMLLKHPVLLPEIPSLSAEQAEDVLKPESGILPAATGRQIHFGKFCDQVVIQVPAGTERESAEYIYRELMKKINGGADEF